MTTRTLAVARPILGTTLPFASFHARVTPAVPNTDVVCGSRSVGLVFA